MKRIIALAALAASLAAGTAQAGQVLDQSHVIDQADADFAVVTSQSLAQTFTVGLDGLLSRIDLQVGQSTGDTGDFTFEIFATAGGSPDSGSPLFSTVIDLANIPISDSSLDPMPLTSIDLAAAGIVVSAGDVLAISLSRVAPGSPPWLTWRSETDSYASGALFLRSSAGDPWSPLEDQSTNFDAGFQTYIGAAAVPEPSTLVSLALGVIGAIGYGLRRRAAH